MSHIGIKGLGPGHSEKHRTQHHETMPFIHHKKIDGMPRQDSSEYLRMTHDLG